MREVACQYCNSLTEYVDSKEVYSKKLWHDLSLQKCGAFVGVHKDTDKPLGTTANKELRVLRMHTHRVFDALLEKNYSYI